MNLIQWHANSVCPDVNSKRLRSWRNHDILYIAGSRIYRDVFCRNLKSVRPIWWRHNDVTSQVAKIINFTKSGHVIYRWKGNWTLMQIQIRNMVWNSSRDMMVYMVASDVIRLSPILMQILTLRNCLIIIHTHGLRYRLFFI